MFCGRPDKRRLPTRRGQAREYALDMFPTLFRKRYEPKERCLSSQSAAQVSLGALSSDRTAI